MQVLSMSIMSSASAGGCPGIESCCTAQVSAGCKSPFCCEAVCSIDVSCCESQWDELCAAHAQEFCAECGADCQPDCDLINVECLDDSGLTSEFSNRRFIGELRRPENEAYCTAWIIGAPNCLITSAHCQVAVGDSAVFNFECASCEGGTLKIAVTFAVTRVIASNTAQDWTLFRVTGNPASQFGLASIDASPLALDQAVYAMHHAGGTVKGFDDGTVTGLDQKPTSCAGSVPVHAVSIAGGTESHGAPVFRADTHCVSAMYGCGDSCSSGFAGPMSTIWSDVQVAILAAGCTPHLCGVSPQCPRSDHGCFAVGVAGCTDVACCQSVCLIDEFCCEVEWDRVCVDEAIQLCPGCGNPGAGDCFMSHLTPFCDDGACCAAVCAIDPTCCNSTWDRQCASEANDVCNGLECGDERAGNCFVGHAQPYCSNEACCDAVCASDPFCCDVIWDVICATVAIQTCCPADVFPSSDACGEGDGDVGAGDLAELLANWGPCTECCADLSPLGIPDGLVGPADLAEMLSTWGACEP